MDKAPFSLTFIRMPVAAPFLSEAFSSLSRSSSAFRSSSDPAVAHASLCIALAYIGRPEEGLEHTARALRISPRDPQKYLLLQAQAVVLFAAARYAEAIE